MGMFTEWRDDEIAKLQQQLQEARAEVERLALEIENQQYTITCASEENQQLKESLSEARAEIERLKRCCNCEYANHKLEICEHPDNEPETFMDGVCDLWSHNI